MRLRNVLYQQRDFAQIAHSETGLPSVLQSLTDAQLDQLLVLKQVTKTTQIIYTSAIAYPLAAQAHCTPATVATQLAQAATAMLTNRSATTAPDAWLEDVTMTATAVGCLQFKVSDRAIVGWLNRIMSTATACHPYLPPSAALPAAFTIHHAHARCCSLLRLAHQEGVITLASVEKSPLYWQFVEPAVIPWLTVADELWLQEPADRALISQLVAAIDQWSEPAFQKPLPLERSAHKVAEAFQAFHRAHPLWGAPINQETTVAQLGLILATQRVLHLLLEALQQPPATEL